MRHGTNKGSRVASPGPRRAPHPGEKKKRQAERQHSVKVPLGVADDRAARDGIGTAPDEPLPQGEEKTEVCAVVPDDDLWIEHQAFAALAQSAVDHDLTKGVAPDRPDRLER